ncbi:DUF1266 domain-containing protein [Sediminicola luteus]|uniref:DUF1266 domain-containing protein n=1 Tax=Sediminicola luteus TaxID=319238 RepID=A0A2A4GDL4_9FLAO|nr:DUF1266 domain-containing protein [Sediminicola luteus]PCE66060.1 hypothetical protein B7P33_01800 [Sediminicola luteus]
MQMFDNLPWYGYIIFIIAVAAYAYRYFSKFKEGYDEADLKTVKFKTSEAGNLTADQQFAVALYAPLTEWYGADTNTLTFLNAKAANRYLQRWRIDTREGYWDLTEYFMKQGRRWYFDFIYKLVKNEPEENWNDLMKGYFGENERAERYLKNLKSDTILNTLKQKGLITFDSEMDVGIIGYDAATLVGQARQAYTTGIITEDEAFKVLQFAKDLATTHFSSWEDFGKSFIIGFAIDQSHRDAAFREEVYHLYKQVVAHPNSPWNTLIWP